MEINVDVKPCVISNKIALNVDSSNRYMYADVRLVNISGRTICYDGLISSIYEIVLIEDKLVSSAIFDNIPLNVIILNRVCENIKKFDKNWSLVSKIIHNSLPAYEFLNWFEDGWLTRSILYFDKNVPCVKENVFEMKLDKIDGVGSDYLPMFSFGTPSIELEPGVFIGCGHLKFVLSKKYLNEKITKFIRNVNDLCKKYDNYIQHSSYIYSMFFYKYVRNSSFFISDSILIISNYEYCFSINFPVGIIEKDGSIMVSYGYGDFYNVIATIGKDEIISSVRHDITKFNIKNFEFNIFSDLK